MIAHSIASSTIGAPAMPVLIGSYLVAWSCLNAITAAADLILNEFNRDTIVNDELQYIKPGSTSAQLLRARGYLAEEFKLITRDNYILSLTRGTNPLYNGGGGSGGGKRGLDTKLPIVFTNSIFLGSRSFLVNSVGVRPRVYDVSNINLSEFSTQQLLELVGDDPAAYSLPFLAMNFGYEVWLFDRRGYGLSRGLANRPNRTLADAWASVPLTFLDNALDGFTLDANLPLGRPNRIPAPPQAASSRTTSGPPTTYSNKAQGKAQTIDFSNVNREYTAAAAAQFPLPFSMGQRNGMSGLWQQLAALAYVPNSSSNLNQIERDFIDTFDPQYWNYSVDEQVEIDFPAVVGFILEKSGKPKLHSVSLSLGGAITLLSLATQPQLANKISRAVLWAPSLNLGSKTDIDYQASFVLPFTQPYQGPVPFLFQVVPQQTAFQVICATKLLQETICESIVDLFGGFSGNQQPARPWFLSDVFQSTGGGEFTQIGQFARTNVPCKFIYNTEAKNFEKYGQATAPCYDLGKIKLARMSFYVGNTDQLVSPSDVATTVSQLKVAAEVNYIRGDGIIFNHLGYLTHKHANRLAILPSLLDIERSQAQELK